jgi:peptidyl-prolyl cis-trans isomerase D
MLQAIRDKTSGWIAYVIIGLISIPFALWGINSYLGGGEEQPSAVVDGVEISQRQLDFAYSRYRERLAEMFGGRIPQGLGDDEILKEQVLTQVIEEQVLLNHIQDEGFRVNDAELFAILRSNPAFVVDGRFDPQHYRDQVASLGYLPAQFEEELRRSTEMQQLGNAIRSSAFVVPAQAERIVELEQQERKIRALTLAADDATIEVSADEIEQYYNDQSGAFSQPARTKVEYIELDLRSVERSVEVTEEQVLQRYETQRDLLTTPEYRTASHILLTTNASMDEGARAQVKERIEQLKSRIAQGEDFATLAQEFSEDPGSASSGGDLGEVEKGVMVKPFEAVLFAMAEGEVSDPVETQFGWHLIKLHSIAGGQTPTLEEARAQIEDDLRTELAENQIYDLAERLATITYEQFDSLLPAAEQLGLQIRTSDWFTRDAGEGIAEDPRVRAAAFTNEVLRENRNSEALELGDNRMVVLHLAEYQAQKALPLSEVRDQIVEALQMRKAREQAVQRGKQLLEALRTGSSLEQVAQQQGLTIQDPGYVKRNGSYAVSSDLVNLAFTLPKPSSAGTPHFEGLSEASGEYSIVELSEVRSSTDQATDKSDSTVQAFGRADSDAEYQALIKLLASRAKVSRTPVAELE